MTYGIFSSWHMSLSLPWCDAAGGVVGLCCPIIIKVTVCHCLTLCSALAWPWRHNTLMAKNNKFFSVKISFNIVNTSTSVSVIILQQKQKQKLIAIFLFCTYLNTKCSAIHQTDYRLQRWKSQGQLIGKADGCWCRDCRGRSWQLVCLGCVQ